ncbi:hypothetical protein RN001_015522 [Aquatica leii]|uniref:Cytochrome P450 n=1 Tax=Aquatica leii TaxID=1421715 RepID=A0AAN7SL94_9COLE|nr:hypothetical protein RN001_015522 [Aquatica leii]
MFLHTVVFVVIILYFCYIAVKKPRNFPPGPPWMPVLGSLPYLHSFSKRVKNSQHVVLQQMCKHWNTKVLGLKCGEQLIIAVCSYPVIKKILDDETYNARPKNFFGELRTMGTKPGITSAEGAVWVEQKRFIMRHLRDVGLGKASMEIKIREELEDTFQYINQNNQKVEIGKLLQHAVINLIWFLTAGKRIQKNDTQFLRLLNLLERRSKAFDMSGGALSHFPWMRFIMPEKIGYNLIKKLNSELKSFLMETIEDHQKTWVQGNETDLMYLFIGEMRTQTDVSTNFTSDQLLMICLDLFVAGAHSTSSTLDYAFLMMLTHYDIQEKVQKLLDESFSKDQEVQYADRHKIPYIQAVLLEVKRYCSVVPIASRRVTKSTVLEEYDIPKDTTVLINLHAVLMNKDVWGDPDVFRPERFLDENGQICIAEEFLPFSMGKRRCLGEPFAKTFLFIFFVEILRKYSILPSLDTETPSIKPQQGIVSLPQKYTAEFRLRH